MGNRRENIGYVVSVAIFSLLVVLFLCVMITSLARNFIDMYVRIGWAWRHPGNYVGLMAGFIAYIAFLPCLVLPRIRHNFKWFRKFTHELTHTLVAIVFFAKIREFVVKDKECYVSYKSGPVGYVPITLSPYCIPIYTFMLFPFRFVGDSHYMIVFDFLIAFTYAFHLHTFISQTRPSQSDIEGCGYALSAAFITFVHSSVIAVILAIPKGGVLKAVCRVFWEYPAEILQTPGVWLENILKFLGF